MFYISNAVNTVVGLLTLAAPGEDTTLMLVPCRCASSAAIPALLASSIPEEPVWTLLLVLLSCNCCIWARWYSVCSAEIT